MNHGPFGQLLRDCLFWFGDMRHRAFTHIHKHTVSPVIADGEIWRVVFAGIEEVPEPRDWETGLCERFAGYAHEEVVLVEEIAALVRPFAFGVFVATAEGVERDPVLGSELVVAESKLHEGEGKGVPWC